ncbi:hypothetical protein AAVH_21512 [Aphelenchoides avenae]|nr:hypothetical protein AAVH_21512 [Aphelenchus avenae]
MDHARLRSYLEEVTREQSQPLGADGEPEWPPRLLSYQVDYRRTYWSETVVLMDDYSRVHYGPKLRKDIDAIRLEADPDAAGDLVLETFFAGSVERIVVMWGSDALEKGFANGIYPTLCWMADHLTDAFSAARIYFVAPPFMYYQMDGWKEAILTLINSAAVKNRVTVVYHPLDVRLMTYYEMYGPGAAWPAEVVSLMDKSANLFPEGLQERKEHMVENYGLRLWTDDGLKPFSMLTETQLLARSKANAFVTTRHFGVPTVDGTEWEQMPKPTAKKAWKPKSTTASRQGSQLSLQGNLSDHRSRRQSEQSEHSMGGYPAVSGWTPTHRPEFSQESSPSSVDEPSLRHADQQPLTLGQIQQLVQESLAQQRAELEAAWAAQHQSTSHQATPQATLGPQGPTGFSGKGQTVRGVSKKAVAAFRKGLNKGSTLNLPSPTTENIGFGRRSFSPDSRRGDSGRTSGVNAAPLHLERELGANLVGNDFQLRQLIDHNYHHLVDGLYRDLRLCNLFDHHPLRRRSLEGLVEEAAPLIVAGRC